MAACPKFVAQAAPFPAVPPRLFRQFPSLLGLPFLVHPHLAPFSSSLPPSLVCPFFSPFFLSRPPLRLHLPPTSMSIRHPPSPSLARVRRSSRLHPQGCILRGPSTPVGHDAIRSVRCYIRYLRRVMYAPVFGRVFTRLLFDDRLCLMLNETRRSYYRSVYCLTPFRQYR